MLSPRGFKVTAGEYRDSILAKTKGLGQVKPKRETLIFLLILSHERGMMMAVVDSYIFLLKEEQCVKERCWPGSFLW